MTQISVYKNFLDNGKMPPSLKSLFEERYKKGLETYGKPLMTEDGRDSMKDLKEELADAILYAHKITLETGNLDRDYLTRLLIQILENM